MTIPDEVERAAREPDDAELAFGLNEITLHVQHWLEWQAKERVAEGLETLPETQVMALPVPSWPRRGQLEKWIETFRLAARRLEARGEISEAMVERAARALQGRLSFVKPWDVVMETARQAYREDARAALEAALSGEKDGN